MYIGLEAMRVAALLLQPIIPKGAGAVLDFLNVPAAERTAAHAQFARNGQRTGVRLNEPPAEWRSGAGIAVFAKFDPKRGMAVRPDPKRKKKETMATAKAVSAAAGAVKSQR
jgi:hypothetical protein